MASLFSHGRPRRLFRISRLTRWIAALTALIIAATPAIAVADPDEADLGDGLSVALEEYLHAEDVLRTATERQKEIKKEIKSTEKQLKALKSEVNEFAAAAYRNNGANTVSAIITSGSPEQAINGITMVNFLGEQSGERFQNFVETQEDLEAEKQELADQKKAAKQALADKEAARDAAADALAANGGNSLPGPSLSDARAPAPTPRNSDGSLPNEGCQLDDPTPANGCVTPRTLHMLHEAQSSGFQRYVSCYRGGGMGEHPMGRACDFSAQAGGFGGIAYGDDKTYGDNLAAWFVQYHHELGVMYVIWYDMYWDASQGWIAYNAGWGDPNSDHTNHVHVSMR